MAEHQTEQSTPAPAGGTVDAAEIARFSAMAETWWDPTGQFKPLHVFNPVRIRFIRDTILQHLARDGGGLRPLEGVRLLDVGCGGGLLCEPLTRLGAQVVGIDAAERNIEVARLHATQSGLEIDYRATTAEALIEQGESFDVVLSMEVVEHVADPDLFLKSVGQLAKPGGLVIAATLNRTTKAFALAIVGAEYVLRWLPRGTHDWKKFLRPSELARGLRGGGLQIVQTTGVSFDPIRQRWSLSDDLGVNYMMVAVKPA
ncbi:MAG: bifunctional 3-demethylubiquinol 3-O-methyltransferase/2-polyprenyl-6-hydroxyphenol methylase [Alphaproteobacteria bacterium]|jgi:2-polyprenyl-6-hydroxyphenyl methylase/3-demethylubiquinone-9 3-methyltransferase|nr:bifunctional 3-demethylubiquinol 3-O-methyltransferase/2-polyprenyl-6-hydroxyphenol methylase [Alphaproteobacteria bacterium]